MKSLQNFLFSTRTMAVLLILFAVAMAVGTFVENDYGTPASKVLIYNALWFEVLMLWLIILFIVNIPRYRLYKKEKWPLLIFHLSFVFIFIGAGITRYISFEGNMPIPEGETSNEIISDKTYFQLEITDGTEVYRYDKSDYMISEFDEKDTKWPFRRQFKGKYQFKNQMVNLKTIDYIPHAKDTIIETLKGKRLLELVTIGNGGRQSIFFQEGDVKNINQTVFSFNNPVPGTVQLTDNGNGLKIKSPFQGDFVQMAGQQVGVISDSAALEESRGKIYFDSVQPLNVRTLYNINATQFVIPNLTKKAKFKYKKGDRNNEKDKERPDAIFVELSTDSHKDTVVIKGGKGARGFDKNVQLGNLNIAIGFGSKVITTPFAIELRDFQLERYPGSTNASSYASEISVIDEGKKSERRIYMNNIMDYKGYRFFQASYFPDETGTILSVNKDWWGTNVTYFGYFLLFFGLLSTLFWKGTRFWKLNEQLRTISKKSLVLIPFILPAFLLSQHSLEQKKLLPLNVDSLIQSYKIDNEHEEKFGRLLIQDNQGRIKPLNTYALELLRKIHKSDDFNGLSATEWFLGMHMAKSEFGRIPLIRVGEKGGKRLEDLTIAEGGYTSVINLLSLNQQGLPFFVLDDQYDKSFSTKAAEQSNFDKEVIKLTERFQITTGIFENQYLKFFPVKNDVEETWSSLSYLTPNDSVESGFNIEINKEAIEFWSKYKDAFLKAQSTKNWQEANKVVDEISDYQKTWGANVLPSQTKIDWEIRYNKLRIFFYSMIAYTVVGSLLLILSFTLLFNDKKWIRTATKIVLGMMFLVFLFQAFGLGLRWYISGHAPWSNGYEAIMFISWVGILAGILLYRNRNAFIPSAGCIVAVIMMGFAHGGSLLDPQITPLVPVLKSYWLMVHVAIITSSYGFFSLAAVLSLLALILIIIRKSKQQQPINHSLKEITIVAEMSLTVGLLTLTIGTFLGGMWANESWGRYWSWDPKETWAFISVIVYAFVLHMRLVPGLRGLWAFNTASLFAIWSIVMTYFGVNYYLSGLHSYAAGDPIPIPAWIPATFAFMILLAVISYVRNKREV